MKLNEFKRLLKNNNGLILSENLIIYNDLELYNLKTEKSIYFNNYDELFRFDIFGNGEQFGDYILKTEAFYNHYDGGRGASSLSGKMGGGFGHSRSDNHMEIRYPAEFNVGGKFRSYDKTLALFAQKYKNAGVEYGITIDEEGFVHKHIKGGRSSVPISGSKGQMVVHNHPGGGNFSDGDLLSISMESSKGIVAVGKDKTYTFTKNKNFKPKEFSKAVRKAQWPVEYSYDKGADWWLRNNAKKYGYKYSATKTK